MHIGKSKESTSEWNPIKLSNEIDKIKQFLIKTPILTDEEFT